MILIIIAFPCVFTAFVNKKISYTISQELRNPNNHNPESTVIHLIFFNIRICLSNINLMYFQFFQEYQALVAKKNGQTIGTLQSAQGGETTISERLEPYLRAEGIQQEMTVRSARQ